MCKLLSALSPTPQKAVCYLSTCAAVDYFSRILPSLLPPSFSLIALHGKQPPQVRTRNFARFVSSSSPTLLLTTDVAARGLDVPNVDLVLQLDPPSDPKTFVHRCGRTGRAGRRGLAVTFLSEGKEESYIEFLSLRGTPVTPLLQPSVSVTAIEAAAATKGIRDQVKQDRALHDAAQRAFVSWVRSYAKHAAASIFNARELDWTALAEAWGLLRLPKMPEAKGWSGDRGLGLKMDWDAFGYKDQVREKRRREELEAFRTEQVADDGANADWKHKYGKSEAERRKEKAWSNKKDGQKTREERREKRTVKREKERRSKLTEDQLRQEDELIALVGEVRRRNQEAFAKGKTVANDENDDWEGFSD